MKLEILPVRHVPEVTPGMKVGECLRDAIASSGFAIGSADIVAVTQKIVSKAEGRIVALSSVEPSPYSDSIARRMSKDPRLVELILRESRRIVRMRGEVLICETHHGFICANAGVDQSNVPGSGFVTLLPEDPDRSAREIAPYTGMRCNRYRYFWQGVARRTRRCCNRYWTGPAIRRFPRTSGFLRT